MAVSVITEAELRTGAAKSTSATKTLRLVENFLRPLGISQRRLHNDPNETVWTH